MKDWILVFSVLIFFTAGYFLMRHLDSFIDSSRRQKSILRISMEDSAMSVPLADCLRDFSAMHPEIEFSYSYGQKNRLLKALTAGRLDLALIYPEAEEIPENLKCRPVRLKLGSSVGEDCTVSPFSDSDITELELVSLGEPMPCSDAGKIIRLLSSAS